MFGRVLKRFMIKPSLTSQLFTFDRSTAICYRFQSCLCKDDEYRGFVYPFPKDMLLLRFMKSSGPGGQNGDSRNTKATLSINISNACWISERTKISLVSKLDTKGNLKVFDQSSRSQLTNKNECFNKLYKILLEHSYITPTPTEEELAEKRLNARAKKERWKQNQRSKRYYRDRDNPF